MVFVQRRHGHPELSGRCQLMTCALAKWQWESWRLSSFPTAMSLLYQRRSLALRQISIFNLFSQITVALNPGWAMHKNFSRKGRPGFLPHRDDYWLPISPLNPSVLICTKLSKRCYSFLLVMRKTPNTRRPRRLLDRLQRCTREICWRWAGHQCPHSVRTVT